MAEVTPYNPPKEEKDRVEKWQKRFKKAKSFHMAYREKRLRMWKLYRAYREKQNYAYQTNLMPPTAFEIIETVKPRLASAKINVRILPRFKKDAKSKSLESWDDKIKYDLDSMEFPDKKIDWINSALIFGDGVGGLTWDLTVEEGRKNGKPNFNIEDLWLFFPDPEATDLQKDSRYEIQLILNKTKEKLIEEEEARGEKEKLYKNLECVSNKKITDDPRKERYEINTKKMGQIATGSGGEEGTVSEEKTEEEKVELWQIWDHEENKLIVIANGEIEIRYDDNPYQRINNGKIFINLPDHAVLWELWSIGHIEPVETTILEIADSRNQAMDNIVLNLDPIKKVRKSAHLTADDLITGPGAMWELQKADDVMTERPTGLPGDWISKDEMLRREIQTSLAISEYAQGLPKSAQEPKGKVDLLLMQTNIRFSLILRQFEIAMTRLVNNLIDLNGEFVTEEEEYRLIGEKINFKEFKNEDKEVKVDARVEIEPKREETPEQRKEDVRELYKIFVAEDKPDPANPEELAQWKTKKRTLQKMILEEFGKEQYEDVILGLEKKEEKEKETEKPPEIPPTPQPIPPGGEMPPASPASPEKARTFLQKIPFINKIPKIST